MNGYTRLALVAALSIVATVRVSQTLGANYSWNTSSGTWSTATNWNPSSVPGAADTAWVINGGTTTIASGVSATCGTLALGGALSGSVQLVSGGSLTVPGGGEYVGYTGSGSFSQSGSTNSVANGVYLGYSTSGAGSYNLGGGSLAALNEYVGYSGTGALTQTAGANSVASNVYLGYSARNVGLLVVPTGSGTYNLSGGSLTTAGSLVLGLSGYGTFAQTGGVVSVANSVSVGYFNSARGAYSLSAGSLLTSGYLIVGFAGIGSFTQSGGMVTAGTANVGTNVGSGSYELTGGTLSVPYESVGGSFSQSGGANLVTSSLSFGSYDLNGGLLGLGGLGDSGGTLTFSGGTMQFLASFSTTNNIFVTSINLNTPGGVGTLDTHGNTVTLTTTIYGPGGLNKVGAGALTLAGSDAYTGPTSVSGGTLVLPLDISTSSFTAASGGTLLFPGTTLNLNARYITALAGGAVVYQNDTVNGGYLFGPGTHILSAGSATTFNATTINPGTVIQEYGNDTFTDVVNSGNVTNSGYLTLLGGRNDGGSLTVNGTADVSAWGNNGGVIAVNSGDVLKNHVSDLVNYGGSQVYVNAGGTLNADSHGEGVALDLRGSLLVNYGTVAGTTNVYYGATAQGNGTFGLINVYEGGTLLISPSASPVMPAAVVSGGSVTGAGSSAVPVTTDGAYLVAPGATDRLTFSGDFSGSGSITKLGAGMVVLSGTNTYQGGTIVLAGTLIVTNDEAIADGSNLTVGNATLFAPLVPSTETSAALPASPVPEPGTMLLVAAVTIFSVALRLLSAAIKRRAVMNRYSRLALIAALSIVAAGRASQALGANYAWSASSGNWSSTANWNPSTVPGPADNASVVNGGTATIGALVNANCNTLAVGGAASGGVQLVSPVGSLTVGSGGEFVGNTGSGLFSQTAGTNSTTAGLVLGTNTGVSGSYNLSGGSLAALYLSDGNSGNGAFTQSGGTNSVATDVAVGTNASGSGSYSLSGNATLSTSSVYVGLSGSGAFTQTGGASSVTSNVYLGYNALSSGTCSLSGGSLATSGNLNVGNSGSGTFVQTAGTNSTIGGLMLGNNSGSSGSYSLSGGSLAASYLTVGNSGSGAFTQSGGAFTVTNNGSIYLGANTGSSGTYNLSGSGVFAAQDEFVGESGNGAFTQSGGSNLIHGSLLLGSASTGSYNLTGGLLLMSGLFKGGGTASFTFSGGTLQLFAGFGLSTSVPIALNVPGGIGTLDTNDNTVTITTTLSGPGGLNKGGAGALTLGGSDVYTGSTSVSGGTLVVPQDIPSSSFTAASGGILQLPGTTLNLGSRFIGAMAGGSVVYQNATINGGFLFGPGTHLLPAGGATTFNGTTINPATTVQQLGNDSFVDVTDHGNVTVSGSLTILGGGVNDGGGNLTVNGTVDASSWSNAGVITISSSGLVNNHVGDLTSYGGARIYVNSGGTLNVNSHGEGTALDLQDSLLVNNGTIAGTTNVNYAATAQGSGTFGLINVFEGGTLLISPSASPVAAAAVVSGGSVAGAGSSALPVTTDGAYFATPNLTDTLTLSGNLSGSGPITKIGPGTLVLSGTNTFGTGTSVEAGTVLVTGNYALPDGSNLSVGSGITAFGAPIPASAAWQIVPVAEPGTLVLLVAGAALLAAYRKRQRRSNRDRAGFGC